MQSNRLINQRERRASTRPLPGAGYRLQREGLKPPPYRGEKTNERLAVT